MESRVTERLEDVSEAAWNSLVVPDQGTSYQQLGLLAAARMHDNRWYYVTVWEAGRPLGQALVYSLTVDSQGFAEGSSRALVKFLRTFYPAFARPRLVECGYPLSSRPPIMFAPGVDRSAVTREVVAAVERIAAAEKVGLICFRDLMDDEPADAADFRGYRRIGGMPCGELAVRWKSFDEYLGAMRKRYRQAARRRLAAGAAAGLRLEVSRAFLPQVDRMLELYAAVFARAREARREELTAEYFRGAASQQGDPAVTVQLWQGERLLGFVLLYERGRTLVGSELGFDYAHNRECALLYNLLYATVRFAIEQGAERVDMGVTSLFPKMSVGATARPLGLYLRHRNPLLHRLMTSAIARFTSSAPPPPLRTFRAP